MGRYYFDVRKGNEVLPDEEGMELPDFATVRKEAVGTVAELLRERISEAACGKLQDLIEVTVKSEKGRVFQVQLVMTVSQLGAT